VHSFVDESTDEQSPLSNLVVTPQASSRCFFRTEDVLKSDKMGQQKRQLESVRKGERAAVNAKDEGD
jgi:hypothetical protein